MRTFHARGLVGSAVAAAAVVAFVVGQVRAPATGDLGTLILTATTAVSFTATGAVVLAGVAGHPVGRLMVAAGAWAALAAVALSWTDAVPLAWLSRWAWVPPLGLIILALLVFPDGNLPGRRWRVLAGGVVVGTVVTAAALAVAAVDHPRTLLTAGVRLTPTAHTFVAVARVSLLLVLACLPAVLWSLALRWRRADGEARHHLTCLLPAGLLAAGGIALDAVGVPGGWLLVPVALSTGMMVAILRYRLYDLDVIVNRTVVSLIMTGLVVAAFVALVGLLRAPVLRGSTTYASLIATGLIAVAFDPLRRRVQRVVDRLVYGERDDPYRVIGRLGELLGQTVEPDAVLPLLTGTIARSLQVPYVAVELDGDDGPRLYAQDGRATTPAESFEMLAHGQRIGRLLVANRSHRGRFTPRERRLLGDVALHAAVAAEATRLTRDLQRSRERIILAGEEERRRLRRELHDGIGPSLTGLAMQVRAACRLVDGSQRLADVLDGIGTDLRSCTADVRELVDRLRPPILDGGLEAALRSECQRFAGAVRIELSVRGDLADLPAAVEVAAYRIVAEALTNVVRHAQATACRITLDRTATALCVGITDDGVGVAPGRHTGVGLSSMRERAAELGGRLTIEPNHPHGTVVAVELPAGGSGG